MAQPNTKIKSGFSDRIPTEESFWTSVGISVILHSVIISVFTLKAVFFPESLPKFERVIKVDIVDLPDKITQYAPPAPVEAKPPPPAPKTPPETIAAPVPPQQAPVVIHSKVKEQELEKKVDVQSALEKIKKMSAIEKIQKQVDEDKKNSASSHKYKGNQITPGSSLTGLNKIIFDDYEGELDRIVRSNWALPTWLDHHNLEARVRIFIDEHGVVTKAEFLKNSGNEAFDNYVIETIKKSSPFPAPPEKFRQIVGVAGVDLGFPE